MLEREREVVERAILHAGHEIVRISREGYETTHKENEDPLTTADTTANAILKERLLGAFADDGWLSEESRDDLSRLGKERVWIIDPIDGTKEFVRGLPEYVISVALVEDTKPVLGAIYNPVTEELFLAVKGEGAWLNGKLIQVKQEPAAPVSVLASRSDTKRGEFAPLVDVFDIRPLGSIAYKLALVASGHADSTISLTPKNEWDIAAGVLLVAEAGGYVRDKSGREFIFNRENTLVNGVVATSAASRDEVLSQLQDNSSHS